MDDQNIKKSEPNAYSVATTKQQQQRNNKKVGLRPPLHARRPPSVLLSSQPKFCSAELRTHAHFQKRRVGGAVPDRHPRSLPSAKTLTYALMATGSSEGSSKREKKQKRKKKNDAGHKNTPAKPQAWKKMCL